MAHTLTLLTRRDKYISTQAARTLRMMRTVSKHTHAGRDRGVVPASQITRVGVCGQPASFSASSTSPKNSPVFRALSILSVDVRSRAGTM